MSLTRMTHPKQGEMFVPQRKVAAYEKAGWKPKRSRPAKKAQAPEQKPGASSLPDNDEKGDH